MADVASADQNCSNCRFSDNVKMNTERYRCRRRAPVSFELASAKFYSAEWPTVRPTYWCGEWEQIAEKHTSEEAT
jgi:hypothetical protein